MSADTRPFDGGTFTQRGACTPAKGPVTVLFLHLRPARPAALLLQCRIEDGEKDTEGKQKKKSKRREAGRTCSAGGPPAPWLPWPPPRPEQPLQRRNRERSEGSSRTTTGAVASMAAAASAVAPGGAAALEKEQRRGRTEMTRVLGWPTAWSLL